jgi:hypothetical protein
VADGAWAFLAVAGTAHGAPRWLLLADERSVPITDLHEIARGLRERLASDPPTRPLDDEAAALVDRFVTLAARHERLLLPRRHQRALRQMHAVVQGWAEAARVTDRFDDANRWAAIAEMADPEVMAAGPDPYVLAQRWLELVTPLVDEHRRTHRRLRYVVLDDITPTLVASPLPLGEVSAAFSELTVSPPLGERVTACILGVPGPPPPGPAGVSAPSRSSHASR